MTAATKVPVKQAPVKQAAIDKEPVKEPVKKATRSTVPLMDYSTVEAETSALPKSTRTRKTVPVPPKFLALLRETKSAPAGEGRSIVLPSEDVADQATSLLRRGAADLGWGVRIRREDAGAGKVRVTFAAQDRRPRKPRKPKV
jgi:hypothetical protein